MSSINNSRLQGDNILHKIVEMTILLEIQERRVEKLKQRLENAQTECDRLKDQLEMYQNATNPGPITKCPAEVLSMIFKHFIKGDPTHVRRLLLVCRYWHDLVVEDPQMWNVIKLSIPEDCWDMSSWADSASVYLMRCVELSRPASLDIELDFQHLRSTDFQLASRLKFGFQELPSVVDSGFDFNLITKWANSLEYHDLSHHEELTMSCYPEYALDVIDELTGPEGRSAERWKSLKVIFPNYYETLTIWKLLTYHSFPNLVWVSLENLWHYGQDPMQAPDLARFPVLEHLEMDGDCYQIILPLLPRSLHTLSLHGCFERQCVYHLSRLSQLRILKMQVEAPPKYGTRNTYIGSNLSLPLLQELHITGDFNHLVPVELDLPSLRLVQIHYSGWECIATNLPRLKPLQLRSVINSGDSNYHAKRLLRLLLLHFAGIKDLIVASQRKEILLDLVQELSLEGLLPAAWETLTLHDNDQIVEVIEIRGMIGDN
jgi:hypothetical protein